MTSEFVDLYKPIAIKKITLATIYQIYEDSDESISDLENDTISDSEEISNSATINESPILPSKSFRAIGNKNIKSTNSKFIKHKCVEIYVPRAIPSFSILIK